MYVLVVRDPQGNETEYDLVGEVVLGREAPGGIQLPDPGVSRSHARLFLEDGLCYLEDLGSSNGTILHGAPVVGAVVLEPGREAVLGPFTIWIEDPAGGAAQPAAGAGADGMLDGVVDPYGDEVESTSTNASPLSEAVGYGLLEGTGGVALGITVSLEDGTTIGRVEGNDVILEDPSVSRQHAQVLIAEGIPLLRDLGSSNGTWINDAPAADTPLMDGDVVRFGEVEFRFVAGEAVVDPGYGTDLALGADPVLGSLATGSLSAAGLRRRNQKKGGLDKRKKLMLGGVLGVSLLLMIGALMKSDPPPQPAGDAGGQADDPNGPAGIKVKVYRLMSQAEQMKGQENWEEAARILKEVIDLDPINKDARDELRKVELDARMRRFYLDAERKSELGADEEALSLFTQIDAESSYHRRARFKVGKLIELIQKRAGSECVSSYKAWRWDDARKFCGRYMDFACQCPGEAEKKLEDYLEKAVAKTRDRWRCPGELAAWVACKNRLQDTGVDPKDLIRKEYREPAIADAVILYWQGSPEKAIKELDKAKKKLRSSTDRDIARNLAEKMAIIDGKRRGGHAEYLRGDYDAAYKEWDIALTNDEALMPSGVRSEVSRSIRDFLVKGFVQRALDQYKVERYEEAFEWTRKGERVAATDTRIQEMFQRLEQTAGYMLMRATSCGEYQTILRITRAEPASPIHKEAQAAASQRGCR